MPRYQQPIDVTEQSGAALSDYQVQLTYGAGATIFQEAAADGSDIRYYDSDDETLLSHWIETFDPANETATIWVRVPSISASSTKTIYSYFGDGQPAQPSDGDSTFDFFDDVESGDLSKWNGSTGAFSAQTAVVYRGSHSIKHSNTTHTGLHAANLAAFTSGPFEIMAAVRDDYSTSSSAAHSGFYISNDNAADRHPMEHQTAFSDTTGDENKIYSNSQSGFLLGRKATDSVDFGANNGVWYLLRVFYEPSTGYTEIEVLDTNHQSLHSASGTLATTGYTHFGLFGWHGPVYYDEVRVRGRVRTEPTTSLGTASKYPLRYATLEGNGALSNARTLTKSRSSTLAGDGELANTRSTSKPRSVSLAGDGSFTSERLPAYKPRSVTLSGDGEVSNQIVFRETFPSELTRDLDWDYSFEREGFESSWLYQVGSDGAGSVALYLEGTLGDRDPATPTAVIDYDETGDGTVDERSQPHAIPGTDQAVVFPELSGGTGYYRILLRDLRPADVLAAVTFGPTHT